MSATEKQPTRFRKCPLEDSQLLRAQVEFSIEARQCVVNWTEARRNVFVITVAIVGGTLIVLGLGVSGYFAYLTQGSEPYRHDALVLGRELCFEDYAPPRATSSMAKSSEESPQEKIVRRTGS